MFPVSAVEDVDEPDEISYSALMWASAYGQVPTVRLLLEHKADVARLVSTSSRHTCDSRPESGGLSAPVIAACEILGISGSQRIRPTNNEFLPLGDVPVPACIGWG